MHLRFRDPTSFPSLEIRSSWPQLFAHFSPLLNSTFPKQLLEGLVAMASGTTVSGGCQVTAGSGQCKGLEDAVSSHIKGKLEGKYMHIFTLICLIKKIVHHET